MIVVEQSKNWLSSKISQIWLSLKALKILLSTKKNLVKSKISEKLSFLSSTAKLAYT